jgi:glyoxylase-like metal-dependent hydrolase (beta-lactamase superfamily II)
VSVGLDDFSPPPLGHARALGAGVHWVRLPVPGPLRHINVWLLEDEGGWTLVDTGMDVPAAREAWQGPLAAYLGGRRIRRILCTHHHPDHAGLAAWLSERHGAPVLMSAREFALLERLAGGAAEASDGEWRIEGFRQAGLEASEGTRAALSGALYRKLVSGVPRDVRVVADGDSLEIGAEPWRAMLVAGHTDAQLVLHAPRAGLLIAGDQVLPRITSNVGIYPEREDRDPVASFVASFARLEALAPEPTVLPSHGEVFRGLRERLSALRTHHAATLERVRGLVSSPISARELAERLFRGPLEGVNLTLAVGEALAHLEHLAFRGELRREELAGGPRRYRPG